MSQGLSSGPMTPRGEGLYRVTENTTGSTARTSFLTEMKQLQGFLECWKAGRTEATGGLGGVRSNWQEKQRKIKMVCVPSGQDGTAGRGRSIWDLTFLLSFAQNPKLL